MADFVIQSLRGGLNDTDPAVTLPQDYCTVADNVEFDLSWLGSRRLGASAITGSGASGGVQWLYRYLPSTNQTLAELWALWVSGTAPALWYKTTAWTQVTSFKDAIDASNNYGYEVQGATIHNKLFLAYKSAADRLHVYDVSVPTVRRTGMAPPAAAPSVADTGSGTFTGKRYYRIRYVETVSGSTKRRSEPSAATAFTPSGSGLAARITKPAAVSEGETNWEVEASLDNVNFYRIASPAVGTTTYDDSTAYGTGYAASPLSEDIGDYTVQHSPKFLVVDGDRLVLGGAWEQEALSSRVSWTPVFNDPGVGNDERIPIDTDNFVDLNTFEGGALTGLSRTTNGYIFAFKRSQVYQLTRTGLRTRAYDHHCLSKDIGALPGSIVEGLDEQGRPCVFFVDPNLGPCRVGSGGVQTCSRDVLTTWRTLNPDAVVCARGVFYQKKRQVQWYVATGSSDYPNLRMVLQTNLMRQTEHDGLRRGWTKHTGTIATARAVCQFAENIEAGTARTHKLVPLIGLSTGKILRCDTGSTDDGTAYAARIVTAPIALAGILNRFGVMAGALMAKAATGVSILVKVIRDFGLETDTATVSLAPSGTEASVIRSVDDLAVSSVRAIQVEFADKSTPDGYFDLERFEFKPSTQETA